MKGTKKGDPGRVAFFVYVPCRSPSSLRDAQAEDGLPSILVDWFLLILFCGLDEIPEQRMRIDGPRF
jgi:hypothetical protein